MRNLSISSWWAQLEGTAQFFWALALFSSVIFILIFIVSLLGFDSDTEIDIESGTGGDFPIFSVKSITAFLTFFSWTGVLLLQEGKSLWQILPYSFIAGFIAMAVVIILVKQFNKFSESGTADVLDLIFEKGEVYLPIPSEKKGSGKVHIVLNNSLRELNAVTEGPDIATGEKVKIIEILNEDTLLVEKIKQLH